MVVLAKFLCLAANQDSPLPLKIIGFTQYAFPILLTIFCIRAFAYEIVMVQSESMQPTLLAGDIVLIDKFSYGLRIPIVGQRLTAGAPKRADIAVYRSTLNQQQTALIKRVVGVPGDQIAYKNRTLYINFTPTMPYSVQNAFIVQADGNLTPVLSAMEMLDHQQHLVLFAWQQPSHKFKYENILVQPNTYFMLGDYRDNSYDSRDSGLVADQQLVGRARFIVLSIDWKQHRVRWNRISRLH